MKTMLIITIALCLASNASVADEKGAKAIFVDTTSGAVVNSNAARKQAAKSSTATRGPAPARASAPPAEVSGLMYYIELVSPASETSRVTTERVFSSGERILLHVISSIDGDIAVFQRAADGRALKLFPDERIGNGSSRIVRGVDTILPSPTSWFRFDNQPGVEELTLVLTPRAATAAPPMSEVPMQTASLQYDKIAMAGGSKGLVVETDSAGPAQGTYVVRRAVSGRPPEPIVVAVRLRHR